MTAWRQDDELAQRAIRKTHWLPVLEKELKSRIGWVDEAVSPFAAEIRAAQAAANIQRDALPPKAA
jgi:hypothetical protein